MRNPCHAWCSQCSSTWLAGAALAPLCCHDMLLGCLTLCMSSIQHMHPECPMLQGDVFLCALLQGLAAHAFFLPQVPRSFPLLSHMHIVNNAGAAAAAAAASQALEHQLPGLLQQVGFSCVCLPSLSLHVGTSVVVAAAAPAARQASEQQCTFPLSSSCTRWLFVMLLTRQCLYLYGIFKSVSPGYSRFADATAG